MSKLRISYIVLLVILGILVALVLSRSLAVSQKYSEVSRQHLLKTEEEHIVQLDITNHEGKETSYTIQTSIDGEKHVHPVSIADGKRFTYIYHIYTDQLTEPDVTFAVYKEGQDSPFEQITYHIE